MATAAPKRMTLAEFLAWWSRLPVYQLVYGRLDDAVREVCALTDRLHGHAATTMPAAPGCRAEA